MNLIDVVFPKKCLECQSFGAYVCQVCYQRIKLGREACCQCGLSSFRGSTHPVHLTPHGLNGLYSLWKHDGVIRKAIWGLKYRFVTQVAEELASLFADEIKTKKLPFNDPVLTPIPLDKKRKRERGFNQAEEIGKLVAELMEWCFVPDLLIKIKSTKPQMKLDKVERSKNIRGAFEISKEYKPKLDTSNQLVIFDDVTTTGATIKEAGKALKRNGVKEVWGLTLAR